MVTVLDGGMGHELKARGVEISGPVGSMRRFLGVAVANLEQQQMVKDAHLAYIDAGAKIITTNTYSCVPKCLDHVAATDLGKTVQKDGIGSIIAEAGKIARAACDERPGCGVKVAGCIPPLAESYRPDKVGAFEDNVKDYNLIVKSIAPYSDLLVCETMSTADEARAAVTAMAVSGLPIWVSWTLNETKPVLRSGESIEAALAAVRSVKGAKIAGLLFNCTSPEIISVAMPMLRKLAPDMPIGAYANGFVTAGSGQGEYRDLSPAQYYDEFVSKWIASGATLVGGCCGVFPRHIAHVSKRLGFAEEAGELFADAANGQSGFITAHPTSAKGNREQDDCEPCEDPYIKNASKL
jgi:S-methylmethionine-dependent homocysteine/selenocysteine methylase